MAYNNPIHFPIHPQQVSSFSSLGVTSIQCPPSGDNRIHVPIIQWTPSSKWKKTVIGPSSSGRIIAFDVSGTPAGYGAGVGDLTAYSNSILSQMIRKGNDAVFSHTRDRKITLCINVGDLSSSIFNILIKFCTSGLVTKSSSGWNLLICFPWVHLSPARSLLLL